MDLILSKKLPYFSEYIKHELESSKRKRRTVWTWPILIPTAFASVLGITYKEDKPGVAGSVRALVDRKVYPTPLWGKSSFSK